MANKRAVRLTTIRQSVDFAASPKTIYDLYTDRRQHARIIGAPVRFERRAGGAFSAWQGGVHGINVALKAPSHIVQAWRAADFPKGHYSIVHLILAPAGRGRTRLSLVHAGVPSAAASGIRENWFACYWRPIREHLMGVRHDRAKNK
jgi:activator of HSP90 ATPase